ncbi:MAG: FKBP-type peptidyl-prolyl cis-trans isomerase [Gemmatimonadales bacterium]|nr:FKBP-type peptidyl-prolyl cis-trans isomerase [Gemmatimonadales bacterium]
MRIPTIAIAAAMLAAACAKEGATPMTAAIDSTTFAPALQVDLSQATKTGSGLYYRDLVVGSGPEVEAGQTVAVHYAGFLTDGTSFDANQPGKEPFTFQPGTGQVIAGWDEGVVGMRVGGKRQLILPPDLGYGARGIGPIPGNAILVFTVDVVAIR